jgi:hypothetical protein
MALGLDGIAVCTYVFIVSVRRGKQLRSEGDSVLRRRMGIGVGVGVEEDGVAPFAY